MGYSNPCRELLKEAEDVFGEQALVSTILSLGSSTGECVTKEDSASLDKILSQVATDAEKIHRDLDHQMGHLGLYFRVSPILCGGSLQISEIEAKTRYYISSTTNAIVDCVHRLQMTKGILPLQPLSKLVTTIFQLSLSQITQLYQYPVTQVIQPGRPGSDL